jgi:hypothetical protein
LEEGRSNEAWYKEVNLLGVQDGPLDQYKHALEKLQLKIPSGKGLAKIGNALVWKLSKDEIARREGIRCYHRRRRRARVTNSGNGRPRTT